MKHFLTILEHTAEEIQELLNLAITLKKAGNEQNTSLLSGKTLGMLFQKPSTRTRLSFEVGMKQLGGNALYIQDMEVGLGKREPVKDVARVMSRYLDAVMIRCHHHSDIEEFSAFSSVPVINALSEKSHPCQAMADLLTIQERMPLNEAHLCYIGDANNVCYSLMSITHLLGVKMSVVAPEGYQPDITMFSHVKCYSDPKEGVTQANVLYTDVWTSMGQEAETQRRLLDFKGLTVCEEMISWAQKGCLVMHCLPAHRGEEISDGAMEHVQSVVFDQAENRLHAQKAILLKLLGGN